ncbi:hypothetical protein EKK97_13515 [Billgrantia tianxiuensis]|uniref:DUF2383 domain-containing protein n=1 Tax=Billgrantia tianxiuensis TaxID=2497861 RepID=A0A6I6SS73_9GAMM|nr:MULTISPECIES: hypothetical protein [Halomonas]MCE8034518.1 hypothetical protein [Halomonas sp. MCCC 1A11057]QHC50395.1 hypothetical protein EKK97_13515 [Halomonas tianxiuensis]
MTATEYQHVIEELERLVCETRHTLARFEATGMHEKMPDDYTRLHEIYAKAISDQRIYTLAMLNL